MERSAYCQRKSPLGTGLLEQQTRCLYCFVGSRDYQLTGTIIVGGNDYSVNLCTDFFDLFIWKP